MRELHIATPFRNEARYLREWIEFHRIVGVTKFHLYQNRSEDDYMSVLKSYISDGIVELIEWPIEPVVQIPAHQDCIARYRGQDIWMAFINCDEFLYSPKYSTVLEALDTFPETWGGVAVDWTIYGGCGLEKYDDRPVIERFTWECVHNEVMGRHIKSVVKMDQAYLNPSNHEVLSEKGLFSESGEQVTSPYTSVHNNSILRLNHYVTKSREEYMYRISYSRADGNLFHVPSDFDWCQFKDIERNDMQTDIIKHLVELKTRL